jgi:AbrB family looped-hinge helix DNA binding protein
MNATVTVDEAGRIVLPEGLREQLNLSAGDALTLVSEGDCITLRPVHATGSMRKEHGVWVFRSGQPLSARVAGETLQQVRQERDVADAGGNT